MSQVKRFDWRMDEYRDAFETLLRCSSERRSLLPFLNRAIGDRPKTSVGIDWGAGNGDLLPVLETTCEKVFAVEPSAPMRQELQSHCPDAIVVEGDILSAVPPVPVDVALLSHVLYHTPDETWDSIVARLANFLTRDGCLYVVLKNSTSGCNDMLAHFGASRFDLRKQLATIPQSHPEFTLLFEQLPAAVTTDSFEDTEAIARFMFCDRNQDEFSKIPTEADFLQYVRDHFWDEQRQRGGWDYGLVICEVTRK
ncbi:MAG: class I SAM-dependent methyltransferase [Rubripirellula sp.]